MESPQRVSPEVVDACKAKGWRFDEFESYDQPGVKFTKADWFSRKHNVGHFVAWRSDAPYLSWPDYVALTRDVDALESAAEAWAAANPEKETT